MKSSPICSFSLPLPPSVNGAYSGKGRRHKSKAYKAWLERCRGFDLPPLIMKDVIIDYVFYFPCKRDRDVQNYLKLVTDYIVDQGVILDDNYRRLPHSMQSFGGISKRNGYVNITIYDAEKYKMDIVPISS